MMELWKKVLIGIGVVIIIFLGIFSFNQYNKIKTQETKIADLQSQVTQLSVQDYTSILRVSANTKQGTIFDPNLITVGQMETKFINDSYVTDPAILKDATWRINLREGTAVTKDMLSLEPVYHTDRYQLLLVDSITPSTEVGNYIDLRMITPDGIDLTVLTKKRLTNIFSTGLETITSETELMIYNGALLDKAMNAGTVMYANKYVDPTLQDKLYATYVPPDIIVDYMNMNKNMIYPYTSDNDVEDMRSYIESVQPWNRYSSTLFDTTIQEIRDKESKVSSIFSKQMQAMTTARAEYIAFKKMQAEANGEVYTGNSAMDSQVPAANVQGDNISGGTQRKETINQDGTYTDSNGVLRKPDGTPVIQASDIVNFEEEKPAEAPLE